MQALGKHTMWNWADSFRTFARCGAIIGMLTMLVSCDGHHGDQPALPENVVSVLPVIDPAVPPATVATIDQINTLVDGVSPGSHVEVPTAEGGRDGLVLALDADDHLRLASVEIPESGTMVLSADSTALALVRIAIGTLPADLGARDVNDSIRATPGYATLVAQLAKAFEAGSAPATNPDVTIATARALEQSVDVMRARLAARAGASTLAEPVTAALPLPFSLLGDAGDSLSVHLVGAGQNGIDLRNSLPIYWSASANGTTVMLPNSSLTAIALGKLSPWLGPDRVTVPDADGASFLLRLEQTAAAKRATVSSIARESLGIALAYLPGGKSVETACKAALVDAFLAPDQLDLLAASPTIESFKDYLIGNMKQFKDWHGVLGTCAPKSPSKWGFFIGRAVVANAELVSGVSAAISVAKAIGVSFQAAQYFKYRDKSVDVKICEDVGRQISNCAVSLLVDPDPIVLAPGATLAPQYLGIDKDGKRTGTPGGLRFSSNRSAVVAVNEARGALTAGAVADTALISVEDKSVPVALSFPVQVSDPKIDPSAPTVAVGQSITLKLVAANGQPIDARGSGMTWGSLDKNIADLNPFSLLGYPNSVSVIGKVDGKATIYAYNPVSGKTAAVTLVVGIPQSGQWSTADLGTLPGPDGTYNYESFNNTPGALRSAPTGLNDAGQVVGSSYGPPMPNNFDFSQRFFVFSGGVMRDIGALSRATWFDSIGTTGGINTHGHVTGSSFSPSTYQDSRGNDVYPGHAFLYSAEAGMKDLGVPPGYLFSVGNGINDADEITGSAYTLDETTGKRIKEQAMLYQAGTMRVIGTLPGFEFSVGVAINKSGQVAGNAFNIDGANKATYRAFLFTKATDGTESITDMMTLGGAETHVLAMNSSGQATGWSTTASGERHAFLYEKGASGTATMRDLGRGAGLSINDQGAVLIEGQGGIYVYSGGQMIDVGAQVSTFTGVSACCINNTGQIAGKGRIHDQMHAWLLTPVR